MSQSLKMPAGFLPVPGSEEGQVSVGEGYPSGGGRK